jgi:hypothetical protein
MDDEILRQLGIVQQQQQTIIKRLESLETNLADVKGSLTVALSRSDETKKKSARSSDSPRKNFSPA